MFKNLISSKEVLRTVIRQPSELVKAKEINFLDVHCKSLIARSPFILVATSNKAGRCDVSPKGDPPGFVQVLGDRHLAIPDRPGNARLDSIENILENPQVGLLFVIPGTRETLRINGKAVITRDEEILNKATVDGKRPTLAIGVEVQEAFIHCAKAFIRSSLWKSETWPDLSDLPSFAKMLIDHVNAENVKTQMTERELDGLLEEDYKKELY
jgi:PPOX class probable FMN-dependent enzyme